MRVAFSFSSPLSVVTLLIGAIGAASCSHPGSPAVRRLTGQLYGSAPNVIDRHGEFRCKTTGRYDGWALRAKYTRSPRALRALLNTRPRLLDDASTRHTLYRMLKCWASIAKLHPLAAVAIQAGVPVSLRFLYDASPCKARPKSHACMKWRKTKAGRRWDLSRDHRWFAEIFRYPHGTATQSRALVRALWKAGVSKDPIGDLLVSARNIHTSPDLQTLVIELVELGAPFTWATYGALARWGGDARARLDRWVASDPALHTKLGAEADKRYGECINRKTCLALWHNAKLAHCKNNRKAGSCGVFFLWPKALAKLKAELAAAYQTCLKGGSYNACPSLWVRDKLKAACKAGQARQCGLLGVWYGVNVNPAKNAALSASVTQRACNLGFAWSCKFHAASLDRKRQTGQAGYYYDQARRHYEKDCAKRHLPSCHSLVALERKLRKRKKARRAAHSRARRKIVRQRKHRERQDRYRRKERKRRWAAENRLAARRRAAECPTNWRSLYSPGGRLRPQYYVCLRRRQAKSNARARRRDYQRAMRRERRKRKRRSRAVTARRMPSHRVIGNCHITKGRVSVQIYDSGELDGDEVKIKLNTRTLRARANLNKPAKFKVRFAKGTNKLDISALNEGSIQPNTAAVVIAPCKGGKAQTFNYTMHKGQRRTVTITSDSGGATASVYSEGQTTPPRPVPPRPGVKPRVRGGFR